MPNLVKTADAATGFWVAVGVLAALAAWHVLSSRISIS